jgi:hypothetical protein
VTGGNLHQTLDICLFADIRRHGKATDLLGHLRRPFSIGVGHHNTLCPLGGEPAAQPAPDAGGAAGDYDNLILNLHKISCCEKSTLFQKLLGGNPPGNLAYFFFAVRGML